MSTQLALNIERIHFLFFFFFFFFPFFSLLTLIPFLRFPSLTQPMYNPPHISRIYKRINRFNYAKLWISVDNIGRDNAIVIDEEKIKSAYREKHARLTRN